MWAPIFLWRPGPLVRVMSMCWFHLFCCSCYLVDPSIHVLTNSNHRWLENLEPIGRIAPKCVSSLVTKIELLLHPRGGQLTLRGVGRLALWAQVALICMLSFDIHSNILQQNYRNMLLIYNMIMLYQFPSNLRKLMTFGMLYYAYNSHQQFPTPKRPLQVPRHPCQNVGAINGTYAILELYEHG